MVTRDNEHGTMWDDIVCLGEVTDYVRAGAPGADYLECPIDYDDYEEDLEDERW